MTSRGENTQLHLAVQVSTAPVNGDANLSAGCGARVLYSCGSYFVTREMLIQSSNNVKIYNLSAGKSLPEVCLTSCDETFVKLF